MCKVHSIPADVGLCYSKTKFSPHVMCQSQILNPLCFWEEEKKHPVLEQSTACTRIRKCCRVIFHSKKMQTDRMTQLTVRCQCHVAWCSASCYLWCHRHNHTVTYGRVVFLWRGWKGKSRWDTRLRWREQGILTECEWQRGSGALSKTGKSISWKKMNGANNQEEVGRRCRVVQFVVIDWLVACCGGGRGFNSFN